MYLRYMYKDKNSLTRQGGRRIKMTLFLGTWLTCLTAMLMLQLLAKALKLTQAVMLRPACDWGYVAQSCVV